jgi:perosamine synthetase
MSRDAWKRYTPGSGWRYEVGVAGLKANMTDVQAAIGRVHLREFDGWQLRRAELADRYDRNLDEIPGIRLPARPATGRHAWHVYVIRIEPAYGVERDLLSAQLAERGIGCSVHFIPTHHHEYYQRALGEGIARSFPGADSVFPQILSLPFHQHLSDEDVDRVCAELADLHVATRPSAAAA